MNQKVFLLYMVPTASKRAKLIGNLVTVTSCEQSKSAITNAQKLWPQLLPFSPRRVSYHFHCQNCSVCELLHDHLLFHSLILVFGVCFLGLIIQHGLRVTCETTANFKSLLSRTYKSAETLMCTNSRNSEEVCTEFSIS